MKQKHIDGYVQKCLINASLSSCPRRQMGALLVDPVTNSILAEGYNGGPRGGSALCGGDHVCDRDRLQIQSGTRTEVGCSHAEANAITQMAAKTLSSRGAWLFVTGEPCMSCAKLILQAHIAKVIAIGGGYAGANGVDFLRKHGVLVEFVDGPQDPR